MLIHLMQHGACMLQELDPHQPLSPMGQEQMEKSGQAARKLGLQFELIIASPKLRSQQTAAIMAQYTGYPTGKIETSEAAKAMASPDSLLDFIRQYDGIDSLLIAGHLPSLSLFASKLLTEGKKLDMQIENGGLMQLETSFPKLKTRLNWHLSPAQLALIAKA